MCSVDVQFECMCSCRRPYHVESTGSRPITAVKQRWARSVLAWVTGWEYRVSPAFNNQTTHNPHPQPPPPQHTDTFYFYLKPQQQQQPIILLLILPLQLPSIPPTKTTYTTIIHIVPIHINSLLCPHTISQTLDQLNYHHYPTHCQSISPHLTSHHITSPHLTSPHLYTIQPDHMKHIQPHTVSINTTNQSYGGQSNISIHQSHTVTISRAHPQPDTRTNT